MFEVFERIEGTRVIAITGQARHGKDTLALALLEAVPGAERFAFSDLLAARERLQGRMATRDPRILQDASRDIPRERLLIAMYHAIEDRRPRLAIITGIRKADEVAMIRRMGGSLVRVLRTEANGKRFQAPDRDPAHPIEQDIDSLGEDRLFAAPSGDLEQLKRFAGVLAAEYI